MSVFNPLLYRLDFSVIHMIMLFSFTIVYVIDYNIVMCGSGIISDVQLHVFCKFEMKDLGPLR